MRRSFDSTAAAPVVLLVLMALGGVVRLLVAAQDLSADELATYWVVSTNDFPGVVSTVSTTAEITPPLGFMLSWLTTQIDLTPEMMRLPALIAGIGTIPLVYAVGLRTVGRAPALLAAALTALSPFMIFYSAEGRGYGVMIALVLLSTLTLLLAVDDGRRRWWVACAVCICLAAYTHYVSIFVLAAQAAWVLWAHPAARRPLIASTVVAALLYVPWLPSMKGDLDSPTTDILSALSPFTFESVKLSLEHWALGFPYSQFSSLRDMPGIPALILIASCIAVGAAGAYLHRASLPAWWRSHERRIGLVLLLAVITPLGAAFTSAIGTNVFSVRTLAASWPYLALAGAGLVSIAPGRIRVAAAALAVIAFGISAIRMITPDYERPPYEEVARYVDAEPGGVLVDGAALTPGPLTNFDVEGSEPSVEVFRLNVPEQSDEPFTRDDPADRTDDIPDPVQLAPRVAAAADGGPITVVSILSEQRVANVRPELDLTDRFVEALPPGYRPAEREVFEGFVDLEAVVYRLGAEQAQG